MAEPTTNLPQEAKKKLPLKVILILAGLLLVEAAAIVTIFMVMGGPPEVQAKEEGALEDEAATGEQPAEELVVAGKFPNTKRGRTYIYDAEIYIVIKKKNQPKISEHIKSMTAQINSDIRTIIGLAEPNHLLEPTLATIKRQIKAALDERLGKDPDGNSFVEQVVITKFTQFRADF